MPGSSAVRGRRTHLLIAVFSAGLALAAFLSIAAIAAARPHGTKTQTTLYVSSTGSDSGACTRHAPCKTIGAAVAKAAKGDTVKVERGTYAEQVTLTTDISLIGVHKPVVDATGQANGVLIKGPGANGALVRGFVIKNATFEGILAVSAARLTIEHNVVLADELYGVFRKQAVSVQLHLEIGSSPLQRSLRHLYLRSSDIVVVE